MFSHSLNNINLLLGEYCVILDFLKGSLQFGGVAHITADLVVFFSGLFIHPLVQDPALGFSGLFFFHCHWEDISALMDVTASYNMRLS